MIAMRLLLVLAMVGCSLDGQSVSIRRPVSIYESGFSTLNGTCGQCLAVADFNGDGRADVLFSFGLQIPGTVFLPGKGDGTFGEGKPLAYVGSSAERVVAGDFNADKKTDTFF